MTIPDLPGSPAAHASVSPCDFSGWPGHARWGAGFRSPHDPPAHPCPSCLLDRRVPRWRPMAVAGQFPAGAPAAPEFCVCPRTRQAARQSLAAGGRCDLVCGLVLRHAAAAPACGRPPARSAQGVRCGHHCADPGGGSALLDLRRSGPSQFPPHDAGRHRIPARAPAGSPAGRGVHSGLLSGAIARRYIRSGTRMPSRSSPVSSCFSTADARPRRLARVASSPSAAIGRAA